MSTLRLPPGRVPHLNLQSLSERSYGKKAVIDLSKSQKPSERGPAKKKSKGFVPQNKRQRQALSTLQILQTRWPKAFSKVQARVRPLKVGIHEEILAQDASLGARRVEQALRFWTQRLCYLESLLKHTQRLDLHGAFVEHVDDASKMAAQHALQTKRQKG